MTGYLIRCLPVLLAFGLSPVCHGQAMPRVGESAPQLSLQQLLQAPIGSTADWTALRGKAVVLEFWATWCGGCVDNIPHLNELAQKFKSKPVVFVSVSDEEKDVVTAFLAKHPIDGWVGVDANENTFKQYGVLGRPQTFLIDSQGVLRGVTNPNSVNEEVLEKLLAGNDLGMPTPTFRLAPIGTESNAPTPLTQVLIRPAASVDVSGMSPGARQITNARHEEWGITLHEMLASFYNVPFSRIEVPEWANQNRYDLSVTTPQGDDGVKLAQDVICATFALKLRQEMRETDVLILRRIPGQEPKVSIMTAKESWHSGFTNGSKQVEYAGPLQELSRVAGGELNTFVFDETGLDKYVFDLKWERHNADSLKEAIRSQLALELVPAQKRLEYLVVDSAREPKTW